MVFLLVFHNDPERPPHAFLLQRVSDRVLVTNLQLFHRSPPPSYSAGRERRLLSRRLTSPCPASACTPACGPPGQSFYGLRLPHRDLLSGREDLAGLGHVSPAQCCSHGKTLVSGVRGVGVLASGLSAAVTDKRALAPQTHGGSV